jgi:hypothetical protein
MENCSIPNSNPATGRISTRWLRLSRKQNSQPRWSVFVIRRSAFSLQKRRQTAAFQSAFRAQEIRRWILDVGRWEFSAIRRVKGAWWPSRSSKPSSPRKWQDRFDSYPLRQIFCRHPKRSVLKSKDPVDISAADSSTLDFARNDKMIERRWHRCRVSKSGS